MTALVLAVDGFGPLNGWGAFIVALLIVIVGGGVLGFVGRKSDERKTRSSR